MQRRNAALASLALSAVLAGCASQEAADSMAAETSHLKPLAVLYGMMGAPESEADFKRFVNGRAKSIFRALDFDSPEELFVSERDGQPYVILYGQRPAGANPDVIGYEQTGVNGRRLVGFRLGEVREVDEAEFKQLVPQ